MMHTLFGSGFIVFEELGVKEGHFLVLLAPIANPLRWSLGVRPTHFPRLPLPNTADSV